MDSSSDIYLQQPYSLQARILSSEEGHASIEALLQSTEEPVQLGSVVAYEFVDHASNWSWSVGRILQLDDHQALLQRWHAQDGRNADVYNALLREQESTKKEIQECQRSVMVLREELAAIRRSNETEVARAKDTIENARRAIAEVEEVRLHDLFNTRLPPAALRLALEACIATLNEGVTEQASWSWEDLRAAVRDPMFIQRLMEYDVAVEMSVEQYEDINGKYMETIRMNRDQMRLPPTDAKTQSGTNALVPLFYDWIIAQVDHFQVFQEVANSQQTTEELSTSIATHTVRMKDLMARKARIDEQLRRYDEGSSAFSGKSTSSAETTYVTFTPINDLSPVTVPRSFIATKVEDSDSEVIVISEEEAQRINSRTVMHRPKLYAALCQALYELKVQKTRNEEGMKELENKNNDNDKLHDKNTALLQQIEDAQNTIDNIQQLFQEQQDINEKLKKEHDEKYDDLNKRNLDALKELTESKEKIKKLQNTQEENDSTLNRYRDQIKKIADQLKELRAENEKLHSHDDRWVPVASRSAVRRIASHHRKEFDGDGWDEVLKTQPEELARAFVSDAADACHVDPEDVQKVVFSPDGKTVEFDVKHDASVPANDIADRIDECPFRSVMRLYGRRGQPKTGMDLLKEQLQAGEQELEQLRASDEEKERALEAFNDEVEKLNEQLAAKEEELEQLRGTDEEKSRAHDALNDEIEKLNGQLAAREQELDQLQNTNEENERALEALNDEVEKLKDELTAKEQELEQLRASDEEKERALEAFNDEVEKLNEQLAAKEEELEQLRGTDEEKSRAHDALNDEIEKLNGQLAAREQELDQLQNTNEENERALEALNDEVEKLKDELTAKEQELEQLRGTDEEKERALEAFNDEVEKLNEQLAAKEEELEQLRGTDEEKSRAHDALNDEIEKLNGQLAAREQELDQLQNTNEENERALEALNDEVEKLKDELTAKEQELEQLCASNEEKERALEAFNDEVEKLKNQLAEQQAENEKLRSHDDRWVPVASRSAGRRIASHHRKEFDGDGWDEVLKTQPEELARAFVSDAADACHVDPEDVQKVVFSPDGKTVEFDVKHDASVPAKDIADRIDECPFRSVMRLYGRRGQPKTGMDLLKEQLQAGEQELEQLRASDEEKERALEAFNDEVEKLNEQLAAKEEELEQLRGTDEEKSRAHDALNDEIEKLNGQLAAREQELDQLQNTNEENERALEALNDEVEKLKDELTAKEQELEQLCASNEEKERALEAFNDEVEELNEQLAAKEEELEQLRGTDEEKSRAHDALNDEIEKLNGQLAAREQELDQLQNTNEENERALEALNDEVEKLKDELTAKEQELEQLRGTDEEKSRAHDALNDEVEKLKDQLAEQQAENEKLRSHDDRWVPVASRSAGRRIASHHRKEFDGDGWDEVLKTQPEELARAFVSDAADACHVDPEDVQKVVFSPDGKTVEFDVKHDASVPAKDIADRIDECPFRSVMRLYGRRGQPKTGMDLLKEQLQAGEQELEQLRASDEEKERALEAFNDEVEKLNEQLAAKEEELEQLRGTDEEKSRAHDALSDEIEKLNGQLAAREQELDQLQNTNEEKERALEALNDELEQLCGTNEEKERALEAFNDEVEKLKNQLAEQQAENEKLRSHDDRWVPVASRSAGRRIASHHRKEFDGDGWDEVLKTQPEELARAFVSDAADACHVDPEDVQKVVFSPDGKTVEFDVKHDASVPANDIADRIDECPFRSVMRLYGRRGQPKTGMDLLKEQLQAGEQELEQLRASDEEKERALEAFNDEVEKLNEQLAAKEEELEQLRGTDEEKSRAHDALNDEIEKLNGQLAAREQELDQLQNTNEEKERALEALNDEVEKLKDELTAKEQELEQLRGTDEEKERALEAFNDEVEKLKDQLAEQQAEKETSLPLMIAGYLLLVVVQVDASLSSPQGVRR
ncbi:hypothetical protein LSM04_006056 [Trypanosoma melophagium]|uniref:uncharacterized protein n=1 Tax=Trypanosoma melophagium TaxID=715481 RepID=UPI00351A4DD0|nr:hypothetical protein LSM04_006056 [Trypanosoma melophagium]